MVQTVPVTSVENSVAPTAPIENSAVPSSPITQNIISPNISNNTGLPSINQSSQNSGGKSRTPDLVNFFNGLSLSGKLEWNKAREDKNRLREQNRMLAIRYPQNAPPDSDDESIFSLDSEDLNLLCDQSVFDSLSNIMPTYIKLELASRKRKRAPGSDNKIADSDAQKIKRRRMDGKLPQLNPNRVSLLEFPQIMFDTEDEGVHLPLPLFHPSCIHHIVTKLSKVPLTRVNPREGESKGRLVLDIDKLSEQFGEELSPVFTYAKYLEAASYYVRFQSSRDVHFDANTGEGNGTWSSVWIDHFAFFSSQPDADPLYPYWRTCEYELRTNILVGKASYDFATYQQHFLIARSHAMPKPTTADSSISRTSNGKQFFRSEGKNTRSNKKLPSPKGKGSPSCLACCGKHTIFHHLSGNLPDTYPDGKSTWCRTADSKLLHPDGREICIIFNLGNFTTKSCDHDSERIHVCSFCGNNHPALSWQCRRPAH